VVALVAFAAAGVPAARF